MIIAAGLKHNILLRLFDGQLHGTYFVPRQDRLASRKSWIAFTLKPQGVLCIDAGAAAALASNGKSLLPSGITAVEGDFRVGAAVNLKAPDGSILGIGLVNYEAGDIRKIMGLKTRDILKRLGTKPYDEVVHRDNLVITADRL
jgi:glutamate 5-kinase